MLGRARRRRCQYGGCASWGLLDKSREEDEHAYSIFCDRRFRSLAAAPHLLRERGWSARVHHGASSSRRPPSWRCRGVSQRGCSRGARESLRRSSPQKCWSTLWSPVSSTRAACVVSRRSSPSVRGWTRRGPSATRVADPARPSRRSPRARRCGGFLVSARASFITGEAHSGRWRSDARLLMHPGLHLVPACELDDWHTAHDLQPNGVQRDPVFAWRPPVVSISSMSRGRVALEARTCPSC